MHWRSRIGAGRAFAYDIEGVTRLRIGEKRLGVLQEAS